jgi:cell wall-associated NlpC family hydrolase
MISHFFTPLPLLPVRKDPSDTSEMVTQLMFGDTGQIIDQERQWQRVRIEGDGYEGWVDEKTLALVTEQDLADMGKSVWIRTPLVVISCRRGERKFMQRLTMGNRFPMGKDMEGRFSAGNWHFAADAGIPVAGPVPTIEGASSMYMGAPYLWGGKSLWGIDCSGLTQMAAAMAGYRLLRDAKQQALQGMEVAFSDRRPGDLAFFTNADDIVTHTGVLITGDLIRHAHGFVREDRCTESGIINVDNHVLTHKLFQIRRIS